MCLGWRLFVRSHSCAANSSRRTLQRRVAARSAGLLHLRRREQPRQTSWAAPWTETSAKWRFNMHAKDLCQGRFPHTQSAYSWQWIHQVSDFILTYYFILEWFQKILSIHRLMIAHCDSVYLLWGLGCWTCGWWRGCWCVSWLPSSCPMSADRSSLQVQISTKTLSCLRHWCSYRKLGGDLCLDSHWIQILPLTKRWETQSDYSSIAPDLVLYSCWVRTAARCLWKMSLWEFAALAALSHSGSHLLSLPANVTVIHAFNKNSTTLWLRSGNIQVSHLALLPTTTTQMAYATVQPRDSPVYTKRVRSQWETRL